MDGISPPLLLLQLLLPFWLLFLLLLLMLILVLFTILRSHLFFLLLTVIHFLVLEVLQLPDTISLALAIFRERLFDQNYIRDLKVLRPILIKLTDIRLKQIVSKNGIVEVQDITQMCIDYEGLVVDTEVFLSGDFDGDLPELLLDGRTTRVEIIVHVLDVDDDELTHSVSSEDCLEAMLPVKSLIDLKGLHGLDIKDVDEL